MTDVTKKINEVIDEMKTLYAISEAEMILVTYTITESSKMGVSLKLTAKVLRAAAHFLDSGEELRELLNRKS